MHTEGARVHEAPECIVRSLDQGRVGTGDDFFQRTAKDVCDDLEEKLTDEHRLRAEVLVSFRELERNPTKPKLLTKIWPRTEPKQARPRPKNHIRKV